MTPLLGLIMHCDIVTQERSVFSGEVQYVSLPGSEGRMGILPNHSSMLTTLGFASVGTLFSALAINTRLRDVMMPILFLPIVVPVIIAAVKATELVLKSRPWGDTIMWVQIIIAFDVIYLVVSTLVFEHVIQE